MNLTTFQHRVLRAMRYYEPNLPYLYELCEMLGANTQSIRKSLAAMKIEYPAEKNIDHVSYRLSQVFKKGYTVADLQRETGMTENMIRTHIPELKLLGCDVNYTKYEKHKVKGKKLEVENCFERVRIRDGVGKGNMGYIVNFDGVNHVKCDDVVYKKESWQLEYI